MVRHWIKGHLPGLAFQNRTVFETTKETTVELD